MCVLLREGILKLIRVAKLSELWSGEKVSVQVEGTKILLINIQGKVFAYEDKCAHKGVPLSTGKLVGTTLTCAAHGWQYDACSGCGINPKNSALLAFHVVITDDDIFLDLRQIRLAVSSRKADFKNHVGPVLVVGQVADALVAAIQKENPLVVIFNQGAYIRVLAPPPCRLTRVGIEEQLKRPFHFPADLEPVMVSFKGSLTFKEDEVQWF